MALEGKILQEYCQQGITINDSDVGARGLTVSLLRMSCVTDHREGCLFYLNLDTRLPMSD